MTTTDQVVPTRCPGWCDHCDPGADGGTHYGKAITIRPQLEEPSHGEHPLIGRPAWSPVEVEVNLSQRHTAMFPTVSLFLKGRFVELTIDEVQDLSEALEGLTMDALEALAAHLGLPELDEAVMA